MSSMARGVHDPESTPAERQVLTTDQGSDIRRRHRYTLAP
jgi:hypothetical protein